MGKHDLELITTAELAKIFRRKAGTVEKGRCSGMLKIPYYKVGRLILYRLLDVEAYLENNRHRHTSDNGGSREGGGK